MTDERRDPSSALAEGLAHVGDRWSLLVVAALERGPRRFGDLLSDLDGVAPNVLTSRLRALEREALVVTRPYSQRPPRFVYELAQAGQELARALQPLAEWASRRHDAALEPPRHGPCGTLLEVRWWCPTCERPVDPGDAEDEEELHLA